MNFRIPSQEEMEAAKAFKSLKHFVAYIWPVLEPGNKLVPNWHIDAICDHLQAVTEGRILQLLINIPPGCMKSWIVAVAWPAWTWLQQPSWKSVFASYAQELSNRDSVRCRQIIESPKYALIKKAMKLNWDLTGDQNTKSYFKNTASGERLALTMKGKVTGFRGDAVVVDDAHLIKPVYNPDEMHQVCEWYDKVLYTRVNDQDTGRRVVIMQRVHDADLSGHIIEKYGDEYEHLILPMEFDPERRAKTSIFEDPRTEAGELLFPGKFSQKAVERLKASLGEDYAGQCLQIPRVTGGDFFKETWYQFWYPPGIPEPAPVQAYDPDVEENIVLPQRCLSISEEVEDIHGSWDCAFKATARSDFVCGTVWGRIKGERASKVLIDRDWGRKSFTETRDAIRKQVFKWPKMFRILVEDAANGPAVLDELRSEIPGMIPIKPQGGKIARANAVTGMFEAGNVWLPHPAVFPWVYTYMNEMTAFPKGAHDDQVDSTTQALLHMKKKVTILI